MAKYDWSIHHIDVKSAYLNSKLKGKTPMYMTPPVSYLKPGQEGMATKFELTSVKPVYIPMLPGEVLSSDQLSSTPTQVAEMSKIPYGNMIGHVLWPVIISHPDAVFTTSIFSQFISIPGPTHIKALKHLILYLYTT